MIIFKVGLKTILAAVLIVGLVGCYDKGPRDYNLRIPNCKQDTAKERAEFILACIKNANPKSDEEPEDWVKLCQTMAEETLCEITPFKVTMMYKGGIWVEEKRQPIKTNNH